jgi:biotin--protein ligase
VSLIVENQPASSSSRQTLDHLYYNGGGHFILPSSSASSDVRVLARYADRPVSVSDGSTEGAIAAVLTSPEKGKALLCSVHFEDPLNDPPARDAIAKLPSQPGKEELEISERARIQWVEDLLALLGLEPPSRRKDRDEELAGVVHGDGEEDPSLLLHPTHPSPVFVLPLPLLPEIGSSSFASAPLREKMIAGEQGWDVLRDGNDELRIAAVEALTEGVPSAEGVTTALAKLRRSPPELEAPPPLDNLTLDDSTPSPPQLPDFHSVPKKILLPSPSIPYSPSWTPLFNFETFWAELQAARKRAGKKSGVMRKDPVDGGSQPALGDLVWYAETVTSTQTMLDR